MHLRPLAILLLSATAAALASPEAAAAHKAAAVKRQGPPPPSEPDTGDLEILSGGRLDHTPTGSVPSFTPTAAPDHDASVTSESPTPTPNEDSDEDDSSSSSTGTSSNLGARPTDAGAAYVAGAAGLLSLAAML